jgi:hypothetical protein
MKLTLEIDKSSAEDCPVGCPCLSFYDDEKEIYPRWICGAFLSFTGDRRDVSVHSSKKSLRIACDECQEEYRKQQGEQK